MQEQGYFLRTQNSIGILHAIDYIKDYNTNIQIFHYNLKTTSHVVDCRIFL